MDLYLPVVPGYAKTAGGYEYVQVCIHNVMNRLRYALRLLFNGT
jgi:hypothetical protein